MIYFSYSYYNIVCFHYRRRSDDRGLAGAPPVNHTAGEVVETGEGSSDEEGDEEEPIYDQPDEGDEE